MSVERKVVAVDLDGTLCWPEVNSEKSEIKYGLALPRKNIIEHVNRLFTEGHEIVIYTARRMKTHNGNVEEVEKDVRKITEDWLDKHGVKYHKIVFGKIYYDLLVDDRSIQPEKLWRVSW